MTSLSDYGKLPPHNVDAEEAVLGSLFVDPDSLVEVVSFLKPEAFYREKNQWVYEACMETYNRNEPINQITVAQELATQGRLEGVGGAGFLSLLVERLPTSLHIEHYARIVHRLYVMRRLIGAAGQIAAIGYEAEADVEAALNKATDALDGVWAKMGETPFTITDLVKQESRPPVYRLKVNEVTLTLSPEQLIEFKPFAKAVMMGCNFVPNIPGKDKASKWTAKINRLLLAVKLEEAPAEASAEYLIWSVAVDLMLNQPEFDTKEEFDAGHVIQRSGNYVLRGSSFIGMWRSRLKQAGRQVDDQMLWRILKDHGAKESVIRWGTGKDKENQRTCWRIPREKLEDSRVSQEAEADGGVMIGEESQKEMPWVV
jgi:hypothetical protein